MGRLAHVGEGLLTERFDAGVRAHRRGDAPPSDPDEAEGWYFDQNARALAARACGGGDDFGAMVAARYPRLARTYGYPCPEPVVERVPTSTEGTNNG